MRTWRHIEERQERCRISWRDARFQNLLVIEGNRIPPENPKDFCVIGFTPTTS